MSTGLVVAVVAAVVIWVVTRVLRMGLREAGLPPGPPTIPILGNAHLFPKKQIHLQYVSLKSRRKKPFELIISRFTEWAKAFGDIYSVGALAQ